MVETFQNWFTNRHDYAREWKKKTGGKVMGYFCTYVPEELLYAADVRNPKFTVFVAGATALVLAVALAVFLGTGISKWASPKFLSVIAGFGFIIIGVWTIVRGLAAA